MDNYASEALRQKESVLAAGGYAVVPHDIYRVVLPELTAKYDGRTARDCVLLYGYFQAHVNGESGGEAYMWAFPTVDKIVEDTGIKRNRVKPLTDILESEGLLVTRRIPWYGHTKKMFMPLYHRQSTVKGTD
ncbi:hypothetical protein [Heyndrickxia oleronia]|uniref:Uncharacterized protein n=1 Tax=Heyndrickxia oleronia TaxID=38875 RepID=A0AAW6SM59_9BACI|nr:hypothetical protein [Heyndrickxia oleronia]MDH5159835.1 hypothetical protein [Heyndrickxia oleronia]